LIPTSQAGWKAPNRPPRLGSSYLSILSNLLERDRIKRGEGGIGGVWKDGWKDGRSEGWKPLG
jgi:hypothetical protein